MQKYRNTENRWGRFYRQLRTIFKWWKHYFSGLSWSLDETKRIKLLFELMTPVVIKRPHLFSVFRFFCISVVFFYWNSQSMFTLSSLELWKCKHWLRISVEENHWKAEKPKYWKQMSRINVQILNWHITHPSKIRIELLYYKDIRCTSWNDYVFSFSKKLCKIQMCHISQVFHVFRFLV